MALIYSDADIATLIAERKPLPAHGVPSFSPNPSGAIMKVSWWLQALRRTSSISFSGEAGLIHSIFRSSWVFVSHSRIVSFVCGVITARVIEHTNRIERQTFYDFHIHMATERYQQLGNRDPREDAYAEVTDRYGDATGALDCLLADAAFVTDGPQGNMFLLAPEV